MADQHKCLSFEGRRDGRCTWMRGDGTCMNMSVNIDAKLAWEKDHGMG